MNKTFVGVFAAALIITGFTGFSNRTSPAVGKYVPDVTIARCVDGTITSTAKFKGGYTLLHFWSRRDASSRFYGKLYQQAIEASSLSPVNLLSVNIDGDTDSLLTREIIRIDRLDGDRQFTTETAKDKLLKTFRMEERLKSFLIDENGVIVAVNPDVETLKAKQLI